MSVFSIGRFVLDMNNWWYGVEKHKAGLQKKSDPLRVGVLSAARINYSAIIDPIQTHPDAVLTAIAARSKQSAQAQIDKYNLGSSGTKAYGSYDELLNDRDIQAVYIPLPNGLHAGWAIKAMRAGKHVLIEKPLTNNAKEARKLQQVAEETGMVALEAFHWRFHPAAHRVRELVHSGKYGAPTAIFAEMNIPAGGVEQENIRYKYSLGGGASMDFTYVLSLSHYLASPNPSQTKTQVLSAVPRLHKHDPLVDEAMETHLILSPSHDNSLPEVHCHTVADLSLSRFLGIIPKLWKTKPSCSISLERARIDWVNFVIPTLGHSITITEKDTGRKVVEKVYVEGPEWGKGVGEVWWTTYRYQLEAFVMACRAKERGEEVGKEGPWMGLDESVRLMETIDMIYDKAGLPRRGEQSSEGS